MMKKLFLSILTAILTPASAVFASTVVYVSEGGDNRIATYSLDEKTGELERTGEVDVGGAVGCLAVSDDKKFIYASVRSIPAFVTLSIDPETGDLKKIGSAPAQGSAAYIWVDNTGGWLLSACYGEGNVGVSKIEKRIVTGDPVCVLDVGKKAHCIQTSPDNRFAFCPHTGELNRVHQFTFDATAGKLALNKPPFLEGAEGAGPRHLQFHPDGKWVYLVNEQSKSVTHCVYDAEKGLLEKRKTLSTHPADWDPTKGSCADIEITADGKFLYASNRTHDSLAIFEIDPDSGELTAHGQVPTEAIPRSFNLIETGGGPEKFVVAAGQKSNTLIVYRRDAETGSLRPLENYECGKAPSWVVGLKLK